MKYKFLIRTIWLCGFLWTSCSKDLGNYNYRDINEITFQTDNNFKSVFLGELLEIEPALNASVSKDEKDYTYRWVMAGTELSDKRNLSIQVSWLPGNYTLEYYVTDGLTGVTWQTRYHVEVKTTVYEGFLVLSEVDGNSRLDMLSFRDGNFVQYTDVLEFTGSSLRLKGKPIRVVSLKMSGSNAKPIYNIFILTDQATNQIDPESFGWSEVMDIRSSFLDKVPAGFKADDLIAFQSWGEGYLNLLQGGRVMYAQRAQPFVYQTSRDFSSFSPKVAGSGYYCAVYNNVEKKFYTLGFGDIDEVDEELFPDYPQGLELVDLFCNNYSYELDDDWNEYHPAHAVLKDPSSGTFKLLGFDIGWDVTYFDDLIAPEIGSASHFAVSPELDYLFYSVGGKVYQYDMGTKNTKLMLDLGAEIITVLQFTSFFRNLDGFPNTNYQEWGKWLTVASYNPGGIQGKNGNMALYSVPPVNQPLVEKYKWTGFGKIASISYRER